MFSTDDLTEDNDQGTVLLNDVVVEDKNLSSYLEFCEKSSDIVSSILEDETLQPYERRLKIDAYRIQASHIAETFFEQLFFCGVLARNLIELVNNIEEHLGPVLEDFSRFNVSVGKESEKGTPVMFKGKLAYLIQNVNVDFILGSAGIDVDEHPDYQILAGFLQRHEHLSMIRNVQIHTLLLSNDLFE